MVNLTKRDSHEDASTSLSARLERMSVAPNDIGLEYYAVTLTADASGKPENAVHSRWVGWDENDPRYELRAARVVSASHAELWKSIGQPCYYIFDDLGLLAFMVAGGNGLIERKYAEEATPHWLVPERSYQLGPIGFVHENLVPTPALKRAPNPKLRMQVIQRDRRRCRICGRNPDDNTDLVLHVHHIRPWERGGLTDPANLITLCHTCHAGLDPHYDPSLFSYISNDGSLSDQPFLDGVMRYRQAVQGWMKNSSQRRNARRA